jgi:tetrahydromethanopterin S-methyltransferase subunit G
MPGEHANSDLDRLAQVEKDIEEVKAEKRDLLGKIQAFEVAGTPAEWFANEGYITLQKRLDTLNNRLAGLEARRDRLEEQSFSAPQQGKKRCIVQCEIRDY